MRVTNAVRLALCAAAFAAGAAGCARSAQTYLDRGNAQMDKGNVAAAVLEYRNAVSKDAMFAPARLKLAEAYLRQGNIAGALAESVRAADLLPNDADAQLKAGSLLLAARQAGDAKDRADKALAIKPNNVDALVLRANALAGLTDLDGALREMQQALSLDPRSTFQANLGYIQAARGNLVEAETAFRKAVSIDPRSAAAQVALGQFLWSVGKRADAEAVFKAALGVDADNVLANRSLAAFYLRTNRAAEAEPYFRKVADASGTVEAAFALVDYYVALKRPTDALTALDKLSADPRYWALARAKVADIQHAEGKSAEAFRTVDEVVTKHPTLVGGRVVRGRLLLADGRFDEALRDAEEAVRLESGSAEAQFLLGSVLEARQDLDGSAKAFAEVVRLNPRAAPAQVRLAMVELQRDALPAATEYAEQAATLDPGNLAAHLVLARALIARRDVERAAAITERLLQGAPEVAQVQHLVGRIALAKGDSARARTAFEKALALDGALVEPLSDLVDLDLQEKQPAAARSRVEQRMRKAPDSSAVLALAGRTWAATGDPAKGEAYLRRAIDADSSSFEAYSLLAGLYLSQQRFDQAVAEYDRLAAKRPGAVGPATVAAMIVEGQGKKQEARSRYERLVEANPHAAVAANNLAWMYASGGEQLDRALQLAQAAKAGLPDEAEVNDTLAFVYIKKQLPALAIPLLRLAIEKNAAKPAFYYHLGLAQAQAGDKTGARQSLEKALTLKADFEGAEEARSLLRSLDVG